jgi:hypothetical protein
MSHEFLVGFSQYGVNGSWNAPGCRLRGALGYLEGLLEVEAALEAGMMVRKERDIWRKRSRYLYSRILDCESGQRRVVVE